MARENLGKGNVSDMVLQWKEIFAPTIACHLLNISQAAPADK